MQRLFYQKMQASGNFIKKRILNRCFPVNIAKFLRAASFYGTPTMDPIMTDFIFKHLWWSYFWKKKATSLRANFIKRGFETGAFLGILCNSLEYILTFILRKHNKMIMRQKLQNCLNCLTLSWRRPLSQRNQSINLRSKSMNWFLYDSGLRHERVKMFRLDWI